MDGANGPKAALRGRAIAGKHGRENHLAANNACPKERRHGIHNILMLPGDGIGPEVAKAAAEIVGWFGKRGVARFEIEQDLVGGAAFDAHGVAISERPWRAPRS